MTNYRLKKERTNGYRIDHHPSFSDRFNIGFNIAWTNLQENEVESRLMLLTAESKPRKVFKSRPDFSL